MQKKILGPELTLYRFQEHFELNILALKSGNRVLLIDSGLSPHGQAVATDLKEQGMEVEVIINSHFHPDHINGNKFFPGAHVWGSCFHATAKHRNPPPNQLLSDGEVLTFNHFQLRFIEAAGHCRHQLVTVIDGQFAFLGDLLMTAYDGVPWLPYIAPDGSIEQYLHDLDIVENLQVPTLIPAHGILITPELKKTLIDTYRFYLLKLKELGPHCSIEDCITEPDKIIHKWHQRNLSNIFRMTGK
ncbi:MAG: MBL fold metallo-hydrolase [Firmicutes bacterium]|nr:MBL fold metallo-hydrolase [Bacillota bacterium]